jgi:hypothetical protein
MSITYHHKVLNTHAGIGIDIDQTLINGPGSQFLQNWVMEFHDKVELHLITFRTGIWFDQLSDDVFRWGIEPHMFKGVHGIPTHIASPFWDLCKKVGDKSSKTFNRKKFERGLLHHKVTEEDYDLLQLNLAMWKGAKCKELGLTALIDDIEHWVVPGCIAHDVAWIDSLKLGFES